MHFEVERVISAPPERIWSILTDGRRLASGPFGILKLEGDIRAGGRIKLWSEASPKRAFPLDIATFEAPRRMVWRGGMPLGAFTGTRVFRLEPSGRDTRFSMREDYTGWMAGLIGKSIPDLTPSFAKFANALKAASEGTA